MITKLMVYEGHGFDPHENLALEKYLLDSVEPDCCILYLWQNQNTVVIGRNQNAWVECRLAALEEAGGKLARRLSGGGAVFHDVGNLNFTFLVPEEDYDVDKQLSVIQKACGHSGIRVEKSGRNDLLANGFKFSGNAFYHAQGKAYHHGTIMVDVDMSKLSAYLSPPKAKLEAKGISSVRSRVVNLKELDPELTCDKMRELMKKAFSEVYGLSAEPFLLTEEGKAEIEALRREYSSFEYLCGTPLPATFTCERKFPWGYIQVQMQVESGAVKVCKVYTDAMEWELSRIVEDALTGCRFHYEELEEALAQHSGEIFRDICALLREQIL